MNPGDTGGPAWGLMQVISVVRSSYNRRFGTGFSADDLLNPEVNVRIASELINRIARDYQKFHPNVKNMQVDWGNPEWVKLLTAGWNSGYSEVAGVGYVAKWLERQGIPVNHDNVIDYAARAGGTRHLYENAEPTRNWQRSVANLFYAEGGDERTSGLIKVGIVVLLAYGLYRVMQ